MTSYLCWHLWEIIGSIISWDNTRPKLIVKCVHCGQIKIVEK